MSEQADQPPHPQPGPEGMHQFPNGEPMSQHDILMATAAAAATAQRQRQNRNNPWLHRQQQTVARIHAATHILR
jgi:hypothetical protein